MPAFHYQGKKIKSQDDINEAKNKSNLVQANTDSCKVENISSPNEAVDDLCKQDSENTFKQTVEKETVSTKF